MPHYASSLTNTSHTSLFSEAVVQREIPLSALSPLRAFGLPSRTFVFSGRGTVLTHAGMLEDLAERSGQPGAMHGLAYLIDHEYTSRKMPHLVCLHASEGEPPFGAVLLFEYRIFGWRTGLFSTGDRFGVRTVVGPEPLRALIAEKACSTLIGQRRGIVLASFKQEVIVAVDPQPACVETAQPAAGEYLWTVQTRLVQDHLPLAESVGATLARLGKRTRTHLRYYRRRLREVVPCEFLADAASLIDPADTALLERLNRGSLEPIAQDIFNLQYRSTVQSPDGFVSGLRSEGGEWLALAGGWRQGGTAWVQWQTNTAAFPSLSLGTAMRLFLIEQEVGRGTRTLAFHGGTSHSMHHAFPSERVVDVIARRGLVPAFFVRILPKLGRLLPSLARRGNFLADALRGPGLRWTKEPPSSYHEGARHIG